MEEFGSRDYRPHGGIDTYHRDSECDVHQGKSKFFQEYFIAESLSSWKIGRVLSFFIDLVIFAVVSLCFLSLNNL